MNETTYDLSSAKKAFSRIGLALSAILVIATVLQVLWFTIPTLILGEDNWVITSSWGLWLGTIVPLYLIAIPLGLLIMRKLPGQTPQKHKLSIKSLLLLVPMCICVMEGGNLIGTILSLVLSGGTAENAVVEYTMDTGPLKVLVMVILAPVLEEYVCRKQIIDRTRQYGEKTAVLLSALVFGLLHQNLYQFFYAFGLGLIFAYIYTRTGRLRYSVLLHGFVNFLGSVVAPWLLSNVDIAAIENLDPTASEEVIMEVLTPMLPGFLMFMLYTLLLMGFAVWGLVLLILKCKKLIWKETDAQLPRGTTIKTVYLNVGMVLYVLLCIASIIIALL